MFVLFATKPLNDGTQGFRFNFAGVKGLTRKRKTLSREGDFLNAQEIADIDDLHHCEDYDPIRFDDTVDGLINALQAIKKDIEQ